MIRKILIAAALIAAVLVAGLAVARLWPSEKKRLKHTLAEIQKAVEKGDADRCLTFISSDYDYDVMNRRALEEFAKSMLAVSGPMQIKTMQEEIQVLQGNKVGVVAGEILSLPCPGSNLPGPIRTSWNLMFRKEGDAWKVWQIELNSVNGQPIGVGGLRELMKLAQP
jgi:hypothetical protein